ncbi:MAG: GGDEF domain-containing protein, partial [Erythrobacter sp.]
AGLKALGIDLLHMLIKPNLTDLAKESHVLILRDYQRMVLRSLSPVETISFSVARPEATGQQSDSWYSLCLRPMRSKDDSVSGTIGVLRAVSQERELERKLLSTALTDQLTGLSNRPAFEMALSEALITGQNGAVVLIEIDHFRAITLRFGQSMGDEVMGAFAKFLTTIVRPGHVTARMEAERFAIFLPACELVHAIAWTQDVIATFARISTDLAFDKTQLSASAGVARLSGSIDNALSRAELGVSVAKASGGTRTECGDWLHGCDNPEPTRLDRSLVASW